MSNNKRRITRHVSPVVAVLLLIGPLAPEGRGNFSLWNDEQFTVSTYHSGGTLYDESRVKIVSGGEVDDLDAYDTSTVDISGGSVAVDNFLDAYDSSTVDISWGSVGYIRAYETSTVDISGGSVHYLRPYNTSTVHISNGLVSQIDTYDTSTVNISGGSVAMGSSFYAYGTVNISGGSVDNLLNAYGTVNMSGSGSVDYIVAYGTVHISGGSVDNNLSAASTSVVDISGGSVAYIQAYDNSTVDISGGAVDNLHVRNGSTATLTGRNFRFGEGLSLSNNRVLGTGFLSGEWCDGTRWAINITGNASEATILAIISECPTPGDTNGDGIVDHSDLSNLVAQFGGIPGAESADFNGNDFVDLDDFSIQRGNFGFGVVTAPEPEFGAAAPEPATLGMLTLGSLELVRRRKPRACKWPQR